MRGKEISVVCDSCGRKMPRNKAVAYEKGVSFSTELHNANDVRFFEKKKVYYCVSCAKHRHIFQRKAEEAERNSRKGRGF
jgi:ribosomal protein S26